ncbi:U11/U12 small nuclear ribonucleoprotein [Thalictrum thalictroides]|uniref:U11/U12 small nuclear ribonucleoprotein n=1 Tax=Thalictrum thalictroides TaxID=46969 RepID=A0A7J6VN53_THATH|nr:U11/U12 small nuclear ribonucleoprotein [Thalictrum thalictroides]
MKCRVSLQSNAHYSEGSKKPQITEQKYTIPTTIIQAGNPATVLYIKNLAKDVIDDFCYLFGSLFDTVEAARCGLSVKLMQEGRMRGQAFVTFPSVELAHRLNLVNGYVFRGKPMIIQFGRNPAAGRAN